MLDSLSCSCIYISFLTKKVKEQCFYCCSIFHSHRRVFNNKHNSYPKMSMNQPLTWNWEIHFMSGNKCYIQFCLCRFHVQNFISQMQHYQHVQENVIIIKCITVKPAHAVTSIKQSPVLKGQLFLVMSQKIQYKWNLF
jgi:hypothetical protein